jgi:hypothetical protein
MRRSQAMIAAGVTVDPSFNGSCGLARARRALPRARGRAVQVRRASAGPACRPAARLRRRAPLAAAQLGRWAVEAAREILAGPWRAAMGRLHLHGVVRGVLALVGDARLEPAAEMSVHKVNGSLLFLAFLGGSPAACRIALPARRQRRRQRARRSEHRPRFHAGPEAVWHLSRSKKRRKERKKKIRPAGFEPAT